VRQFVVGNDQGQSPCRVEL